MSLKTDKKEYDALKLFQQVDAGETPLCPLCGEGRVHSVGKCAYACDKDGCRYQIVITRGYAK